VSEAEAEAKEEEAEEAEACESVDSERVCGESSGREELSLTVSVDSPSLSAVVRRRLAVAGLMRGRENRLPVGMRGQ
jgi:hypothetical protein